MRRLKLLNLTCVGKNGEYASVDFGSEVTVLRGSPNMDESIVDVILHIFDLRGYPLSWQWWKFDSFLLGVELPTGQHITFARSNSNHSSVFRLVGNAGKDIPWENLPQKNRHDHLAEYINLHGERIEDISSLLIQELGLSNKKIRCNEKNKTRKLKFSDLANQCLMNERALHPKRVQEAPGFSIVYPGNKYEKAAALKLMLTGKDDSALKPGHSSKERDLIYKAQLEIINQIIDQVKPQLDNVPASDILECQLNEVNDRIQERSSRLTPLLNERSELHNELRSLQDQSDALNLEQAETKTLRSRFGLLEQQYRNDLERLEMVTQSNDKLAYLQTHDQDSDDVAPSSQLSSSGVAEPDSVVYTAARAEAQNTMQLLDGLNATTADMDDRIVAFQAMISRTDEAAKSVRQRIRALDTKITSKDQGNLRILLGQRTDLEKYLSLHEQFKTYQDLKENLRKSQFQNDAPDPEGVSSDVAQDFAQRILRNLRQWAGWYVNMEAYIDILEGSRPGDDTNEYTFIVTKAQYPDETVGGRGQMALHLASMISLEQHCFQYQTPHPGFVVLPSLLYPYWFWYKSDDDEEVKEMKKLAETFYGDLRKNKAGGQIIIIEDADTDVLPDFLVQEDNSPDSTMKYIDLEEQGFPPLNSSRSW